MSQPRQPTPSQSPTPSKSSLRRTSGAQNPSQRSLIPSPHFEDPPAAPLRYSPRSPPNQTLEYESDEDDDPLIYPEPPPPADDGSYFPYPEPEQPLQPFFTLIEDGLTAEHHHPSVHYIFADDDTDIITEAALRSLDLDRDQQLGNSSVADDEAEGPNPSNPPIHTETRLPPPAPGVREHYLILDVHPLTQAQARQQIQNQAQSQSQSQNTGAADFLPSYAITSFTSLSPDWQVSSASITSAPTMGDAPDEDEGLMLRIEGRGVPPLDDLDLLSDAARVRDRDNLEDMIERFQARLGEVKRLIDIDQGFPNRGISAGGEGAGNSSEQVHVGIGLEEQD